MSSSSRELMAAHRILRISPKEKLERLLKVDYHHKLVNEASVSFDESKDEDTKLGYLKEIIDNLLFARNYDANINTTSAIVSFINRFASAVDRYPEIKEQISAHLKIMTNELTVHLEAGLTILENMDPILKQKRMAMKTFYARCKSNLMFATRHADPIKLSEELINLDNAWEYFQLAITSKYEDPEVTRLAMAIVQASCPSFKNIPELRTDFVELENDVNQGHVELKKLCFETEFNLNLHMKLKQSFEKVFLIEAKESNPNELLFRFRAYLHFYQQKIKASEDSEIYTADYMRYLRRNKFNRTTAFLQLHAAAMRETDPVKNLRYNIAVSLACRILPPIDTQSVTGEELQLTNFICNKIYHYLKILHLHANEPKYYEDAIDYANFTIWFALHADKFLKNKVPELFTDVYLTMMKVLKSMVHYIAVKRAEMVLTLTKLKAGVKVDEENSVEEKSEIPQKKKKAKKKKKKNKLKAIPANPFKSTPQVMSKINDQDDLEQKAHQEFLLQQQKEADAKKEEAQQLKYQQELLKKQKLEDDKKAQVLLRQAKNAELRMKEELTEQKRAEEAAFLRDKEAARLKLVSDLQEQAIAAQKLREEKEFELHKKAIKHAKVKKELAHLPATSFHGEFAKIQPLLQHYLKTHFGSQDIYYVVGGYVRYALGLEPTLHDIDILATFGQQDTLKKTKVNQIPSEMIISETQKIAIEKTYKKRTKLGDYTTLDEEAESRDFTSSALYLDHLSLSKSKIEEKDVIDPTGKGIADLRAGILRTVLEARAAEDDEAQMDAAKKSLENDPKRVIRAAAFMTREINPLKPTPALEKALKQSAELFLPWRLNFDVDRKYKYKFESILKKINGYSLFKKLHEWGVLQIFFPEFEAALKLPHSFEMLKGITDPNIYKYIAHLMFHQIVSDRSNKHRLLSDPREMKNNECLSAAAIGYFVDKNPLLKHLFQMNHSDFRAEWNRLVAMHRAEMKTQSSHSIFYAPQDVEVNGFQPPRI